MTVRVVTSPQVVTLTRVETLYRVVKEFVESAAGYPCPETVRKGIVDSPYLQAIHIMLVNQDREKTAEVTLRIDWERHRIFASGMGGATFEVDPTRLISEQISGVLGRLRAFIGQVRETGRFTAEVWYTPRSDATVSYQEACRALGFSTGATKQLEWAKGKFIHTVFRGVRMEELQVDLKALVE